MPADTSQQLFELAKKGEAEALMNYISQIEPDQEQGMNLIYQWLQVAAAYGSEEAAGMADDVYEAVLQVSDETVADLHFEVARWFIKGENSVEQNFERGLDQLKMAQDFQFRESIQDSEKDLSELRALLPAQYHTQFDEIFPGL